MSDPPKGEGRPVSAYIRVYTFLAEFMIRSHPVARHAPKSCPTIVKRIGRGM